ncbi:hypothetical protein R3P38DRAFT_3497841 [Favolaschia claudopus]|uniref:Transposase n=1 Tax=Favolaschia claudopus TaxID=2862362 RepID=A0AAV9Z3M9_9AGAR
MEDLSPLVHDLQRLLNQHGSLFAPHSIGDSLLLAISYFSDSENLPSPSPEAVASITSSDPTPSSRLPNPPSIRHGLSLGSSWFNPARTFAYSRGEPSGSTGRKTVVFDILVDSNGNKARAVKRVSKPILATDPTSRFRVACGHCKAVAGLSDASRKALVNPYVGSAFVRSVYLVLKENRCEHYNRKANIDHLVDYEAGRGLYDTQYLEALFSGDENMIADFEEDGLSVSDTGTLAVCSTVANFSIKVNCSNEHRDENGRVALLELQQLKCKSKFRIFEPVEEQRAECPYILVICHGAHTHPIPLPTKTPPRIREEIFDLLSSLDHDLPDLTPRRLLRHPTTHAFLRKRIPDVSNPTLLDLHPSLGNRDHIRAYILQAQENIFPEGTGWEGLVRMKQEQDENLPEQEAYIRYMEEFSATDLTHDPDDEDEDIESISPDSDLPFRIAVCMTKEGSLRLLKAQYIQSDIAFRRIVGFKEFELGALERGSRTTTAHELIFKKIHEIVLADTGEALRWRHLHSPTIHAEVGILHITLDQHGGQAKGLGLHLKSRAQELADEFDHLRVSMSTITYFASRASALPIFSAIYERLMFLSFLVCIKHPEWDSAVLRIQVEGGIPGANWVADKIRSKFAFPAMCWAKSFIPKTIWQVGDNTSNLFESVHADANREGVSCTLVGGVKKGHLDTLRMKSLTNLEGTGVRTSYARGHISESTMRSLRRKSRQAGWKNRSSEQANTNCAHLEAQGRGSLNGTTGSQMQLTKAHNALVRANDKFEKALAASMEVVGSGSGKVGLLLPSRAARDTRDNV